jgi:hypothetical protein
MIKPIRTENELLPEDASYEGQQYDFKKSVDANDGIELAKDIAAFANAVGGAILVGAVGEGERLDHYKPLPRGYAEKVLRGYDQAVRDRCSPKPFFEPAMIPRGEGIIVSVNVSPFPGQPVGVRVDNKGSFRFPYRTGTNTIYLAPDQLPMFMLPDVRRVAILLSSIPPEERNRVVLLGRARFPGDPHCRQIGSLEKFDLDEVTMKNTVTFQKISASGDVCIPADSIDHVYRDTEWRPGRRELRSEADPASHG